MSSSLLALAVAGPAGRLGSAILRAAAAARDVRLVSGLARPGSGAVGMDLSVFIGCEDLGVTATDDLRAAVDEAHVLIDVSTASAAAEHATALAERGGPALVVGATGYTADEDAAIRAAARRIPIVRARNFSLAVTVLAELTRIASARLGDDWDVEIVEMHHRSKSDAPSGTAIMLGEAAAEGRGVDFDEAAIRSREGMTGPRPKGAIGFASLRGGGVVGDHDVILAGNDGMIQLGHRAFDRNIFAKGALAAARWAKDQPPGLYDMRDVLGFTREMAEPELEA